MRYQFESEKKRRVSLAAGLVGISLCVTLVTLGISSIWSYNEQQSQEQTQMLVEARLLDKAVYSAWEFVGFQQDRINTDADGSYNFKGIYCSLVGKSVGKLFSQSTGFEYELRYIRENPRNSTDTPDSFEANALRVIDTGVQDEYYGVETQEDGKDRFRYVRAIRLTKDCLDCHGSPADQIDVTGFEKEGLGIGDIGGAVSIVMPMAARTADIQSNTFRNISFSVLMVLIIVAVFVFFAHHFVIAPLNELKRAAAEIGKGNIQISLEDLRATSEVDELARYIEIMSSQLSDLYHNLEEKINDKTRQYQEANELLSAQQNEIAQVNDLLSEANTKLQEENEYRTNFLSMISHELRTPLTAIMSFTELWEKSPKEDATNNLEYIQKIKSYSMSLLQMINNTLDMAHIDAGKIELASEDVDLVDLISEIEFIALPLANAKGIELNTQVDRDVPLIRSDWDQIKKIILNLVSNAIKFTDEGGRVDVRVSLNASERLIIISVEDNGIGIEEDRRGSIFDRFVQVDLSMSRKYGGSGLGLALVSEITTLLGGSIDVTSALGEGSEFVVRLPFEENERYKI